MLTTACARHSGQAVVSGEVTNLGISALRAPPLLLGAWLVSGNRVLLACQSVLETVPTSFPLTCPLLPGPLPPTAGSSSSEQKRSARMDRWASRARPSMAATCSAGPGPPHPDTTHHGPSSAIVHPASALSSGTCPLGSRLDLPGQVAFPSALQFRFVLWCIWRPSSSWRAAGAHAQHSAPSTWQRTWHTEGPTRVSQGHDAACTCVRDDERVRGRVSVTRRPWHGGCLR